jgi:ppGpp synthetase/RelA/SpoT-type nucleotidyltranferase
VKVEIVNKGEKFTKAKYQGILGDYDKDGIANADDSQPLTKEFSTVVDNPKFSTAFNSLLSIKKNMDKNMYGFIKELKTVSPPNSTIYARTKTPFSILNKLIQKRLQDARKGLTDLIGTTIVVDNQQTLYQVRDALLSGKLGEVIEFEDFYEKPQHGYRAFHFLIRYANSPVEVQVKTKRQKELNQLTHEPYKQNRLNKELSDEMTLNAVYADEGDRQAIAKHQAFMSGKNLEKAFFM